jgi:uncharacterized protein (TIGR03435 family)
MKTNVRLIAIVASSFLATPAPAQRAPQFDAATIKLDHWGPGEGGMIGGPGTNSPGRIRWRFASLRDLVAAAYHVQGAYVSGPSWITGDNGNQIYVLTVTLSANTSKPDFELMLRAFLAEQFKLKVHHETKLFPGFELVLAPGGPKLKASAVPDGPDAPDASLFMVRPGAKVLGADGFPEMPPGHGMRSANVQGGIHARFQGYTMAEFAERIATYLPPASHNWYLVTDKTGLTGKYDFTLQFEKGVDSIVIGPGGQPIMANRDDSAPGSGLPNLFKAVEQQLGLKLVKVKDIPVDTIEIDHADKLPAGN